MKKIFFAAAAALISVVTVLIGCTVKRENNKSDAEKTAKEEFGFEKIYFTSSGTAENTSINFSHYFFYVLGEKDGEEIFITVPDKKGERSSLYDWPLNLTFKEITQKLNAFYGGEIYTSDNFAFTEIIDSGFENFGIDETALDVKFMLSFGKYYAVQIGGEIRFGKTS